MNNRDRNIQIFEEGKRLWETNERLCKSIARSIRTQRFVGAKEEIPFSPSTEGDPARVVVSRKRTLEAAEPYVREGRKTCILNFASATNPGGGVTRGSSAQEECICRSSTLYPCLNTRDLWNRFYSPHRKTGNPLHNDDCIYTPNVCVFRADAAIPELLQEEDWWNVNVITCAAPNLRRVTSNLPAELEKQLPSIEDIQKRINTNTTSNNS